MTEITLLHGSNNIIESPNLKSGKFDNDYGQGLYCTKDEALAAEWACKDNTDGYVNFYKLKIDDLTELNLLKGEYNILNWMAILLSHRTFTLRSEVSNDAKKYLIKNFGINLSPYDLVTGYRADDSYFAYATAFIENSIPLRTLNYALRLGNLGVQTALVSKKAFDNLTFEKSTQVNREIYYPKFISRDVTARETYKKSLSKKKPYKDDIFMIDILREGMKNDDPRIQRIVSK